VINAPLTAAGKIDNDRSDFRAARIQSGKPKRYTPPIIIGQATPLAVRKRHEM
jgi:hypothetical protein